MTPFMKWCIPAIALAGCMSGCATTQVAPPKEDPLVNLVSSFAALGQSVNAVQRADAIRADSSTLFPSRAQAVALALLVYQSENHAWPKSAETLQSFLNQRDQEKAPPQEAMATLRLESIPDGQIRFYFAELDHIQRFYDLSPNGTISFPLIRQPVAASTTTEPTAAATGYNWGDLAARLLIELPLRILQYRQTGSTTP